MRYVPRNVVEKCGANVETGSGNVTRLGRMVTCLLTRLTKGDEQMRKRIFTRQHYAYWTAIKVACAKVNDVCDHYHIDGCMYVVPCDDGQFAVLGEGELIDTDRPICRVGRDMHKVDLRPDPGPKVHDPEYDFSDDDRMTGTMWGVKG